VTPDQQLLQRFTAALRDNTFVRLTLTNPATATLAGKVIARLVTLKGIQHLSLTLRYPTRDETRNLPVTQAADWLRDELSRYNSALLATTLRDWQLQPTGRLIGHKPAATTPLSRSHDRAKQTLLDASARDWLPAGADKQRQVHRYVEILSHLARDCGWDKTTTPLTIADMGCGKGHLTFGTWHLFHRVWHRPVHVIGVELRPALVADANRLAGEIHADGLEFLPGTIDSVTLPPIDALIALHACDTATDDAIRRGIQLGAKLIVVAPCCHQQIRPELGQPAPLAPILEHGIMTERMAEWVTDGLRALYLEAAGYRTKVIEFVASEHTPKNLLLAGIRTGSKPGSWEKIREVKTFFGLCHHPLDDLERH
jgi:SAM-dependent methyltransferase